MLEASEVNNYSPFNPFNISQALDRSEFNFRVQDMRVSKPPQGIPLVLPQSNDASNLSQSQIYSSGPKLLRGDTFSGKPQKDGLIDDGASYYRGVQPQDVRGSTLFQQSHRSKSADAFSMAFSYKYEDVG